MRKRLLRNVLMSAAAVSVLVCPAAAADKNGDRAVTAEVPVQRLPPHVRPVSPPETMDNSPSRLPLWVPAAGCLLVVCGAGLTWWAWRQRSS